MTLKYFEKGIPLSRAKAHVVLPATKMPLNSENMMLTKMRHVIAIAAGMLLVACARIARTGTPVGDATTSLMSWTQNNRAIKNEKDVIIPVINAPSMARGTSLSGFGISSYGTPRVNLLFQK
jgi:hypothetical protein